jgi:hypothetical protein
MKVKFRLSIICLALFLTMTGCGRSSAGRDQAPGKPESPAATDAAVLQGQNAVKYDAASGSIESVTLSPLDPTRDSTMIVTVKTNPEKLPEETQIQYIYWVNAAIAKKSRENSFSLAGCKKNNLFYVDAVLLQGEREISSKRSLMVKILNSSPLIKGVDFPDLKGPGTYSIKVNAFDAEGDPLSYSLAGEGVPAGTAIDPGGMITISLTDQSPENIVFWAVVKDNEEGETRQEIKIAFAKKLNTDKQK